jgi:hypothetical protein
MSRRDNRRFGLSSDFSRLTKGASASDRRINSRLGAKRRLSSGQKKIGLRSRFIDAVHATLQALLDMPGMGMASWRSRHSRP